MYEDDARGDGDNASTVDKEVGCTSRAGSTRGEDGSDVGSTSGDHAAEGGTSVDYSEDEDIPDLLLSEEMEDMEDEIDNDDGDEEIELNRKSAGMYSHCVQLFKP
jgi:hypothetical protein